MPEQPAQKFKADMPQIPGVSGSGGGSKNIRPGVRLVVGVLAALLICILGARWIRRPRETHPPVAVAPAPQIEVAAPAPDPNSLVPHATETDPAIASVHEMEKPWSSKDFFFRNQLSGENVPALLIRLPTGNAAQPGGYWALAMNAPFGNCQLEYVTDLDKLRNDYTFAAAKHPMVGNPCSRTLFDPLKMASLPTGAWVRGAIVQGSDLRPPLGIELKLQNGKILAVRSE